MGLVEHQRGHQVLKHRTRPRAQAGLRAAGKKWPAQRRPVAHRHIPFGDGPQTGEARLRCQQVIEASIQLLFGDTEAEVQQVPLAVIQEAEVGLGGEPFAVLHQRAQARRRIFVFSVARQLGAGLRHRQQVATEVAAVDGGDVHRQQWRQRLRVIPVHEVAAMALQLVQRRQCRLQAADQLQRADPAELPRAGRAQQVQADVGGRGAVRHHVLRNGLQIVWRQMVVFGPDAALEVAPTVACDAGKIGPVIKRQLAGALTRRQRRVRPTHPPRPQRCQGP